jgi:lactoylglutathione lyase
MALRAFPVLHAKDVEAVAGFYAQLGFVEQARVPGPDGSAGFIGLRRDAAELAVTTEDSPRQLAGVEPGAGPRGELFVYVERLDDVVDELRSNGATVLREPTDMPWGERVAFVTDPEGNLVTLAAAAST